MLLAALHDRFNRLSANPDSFLKDALYRKRLHFPHSLKMSIRLRLALQFGSILAVTLLLGLAVSELPDAQKKELKIKGGIKVDAAEGAAARAGLREGDVILSVANTEVNTLKEFDAALSKTDKTKPINVLFRRGEWAQYALIRPLR